MAAGTAGDDRRPGSYLSGHAERDHQIGSAHWAEAVHLRPLRALALRKAEKWLLERLEMTDGLGAIYPAMLNAIIALRCLGYSEDDPQVIRARDEFEKLGIEQSPTAGMPE